MARDRRPSSRAWASNWLCGTAAGIPLDEARRRYAPVVAGDGQQLAQVRPAPCACPAPRRGPRCGARARPSRWKWAATAHRLAAPPDDRRGDQRAVEQRGPRAALSATARARAGRAVPCRRAPGDGEDGTGDVRGRRPVGVRPGDRRRLSSRDRQRRDGECAAQEAKRRVPLRVAQPPEARARGREQPRRRAIGPKTRELGEQRRGSARRGGGSTRRASARESAMPDGAELVRQVPGHVGATDAARRPHRRAPCGAAGGDPAPAEREVQMQAEATKRSMLYLLSMPCAERDAAHQRQPTTTGRCRPGA